MDRKALETRVKTLEAVLDIENLKNEILAQYRPEGLGTGG